MITRFTKLAISAALAGVMLSLPLNAAAQNGSVVVLSAADFLPADQLQSPYHRVDPRVMNDGYANQYRIETPRGEHVVFGTDQALARIHEIYVTEQLREKSVAGTAVQAVGERVANLGQTPLRAVKGVVNRAGDIDTAQDALLFVPSGVGRVVERLAKGTGELLVTGARITKGAAGTQCAGLNCVEKAAEDIWSGANSLVGKHADARALHNQFGTDYQTENKALKRQIDRLSYASSYTSTATKFGLSGAGIDVISPLATGVGYYNNAEFVAGYEDAHRTRNAQKDLLASWGIAPDIITRLYKNDAYTHKMRALVVDRLSVLGTQDVKARLVTNAADAPNRYLADRQVKTLDYLAHLSTQGAVSAYVLDGPVPVVLAPNGALIMPLVVDYIRWTDDVDAALGGIAKLVQSNPDFKRGDIHILGRMAPDFVQNCTRLGLSCQEISPRRT